ncbi:MULTISPECIES: LTXXQ domain protein [Pseudomonas]|uniref:P pilus assembly/Cpx signaling pathway, periplasmic inhibitor/zinc-resistance associated protein n=1 Tax=Pseudomonas asplenii TaxID=53407 RepID=A0A0N1J5Q5_9PSED|nr:MULTISPECIES: LTXXQ domain protein [Pseudomonas]KPA88632.1 P pilus assembly/Cpx signaling pathway, periplasmic inhibitor/zinc-resistance associated protein [Pseudomonas fuscovaginae]KPA98404.1 P pilus assembly/Cpx signaling pathway, periplasmic inhibitor/zinc-resistance associated protein [Pseudomonas fuscovaginae]
MRKTLIALMFAAALPTVAMAMPEGGGPLGGPGGPHGGEPHWKAPYGQLDLSREQRHAIGRLMGEQMHARKELTEKYLAKLSPADQAAFQGELDAARQKTDGEIRALLKPDQQKTFDEIQKKRAERRAEWAEFKAWKAQHAQKAQ